MDAAGLDRTFDDGEEDVLGHIGLDSATRPYRQVRRVNVDVPEWVFEALDVEAQRLGVTRQSVIKVWIAERLERAS
ncbi:MAG: hypothetical protein P1P87_00710 [Trueperaceae bacterium]|nr:hypothetical protein [Trueperaceae bacterium]